MESRGVQTEGMLGYLREGADVERREGASCGASDNSWEDVSVKA